MLGKDDCELFAPLRDLNNNRWSDITYYIYIGTITTENNKKSDMLPNPIKAPDRSEHSRKRIIQENTRVRQSTHTGAPRLKRRNIKLTSGSNNSQIS